MADGADKTHNDVSGAVIVKRFNNGWTRELECLIADWADRAMCYRWMHDNTGRKYSRYNQYMMIPVIVLSTLTGTANFGLDSFFPDGSSGGKRYASLGIGGVSILTGIISTVANFLRYGQGSESHSVSAISWAKFSRLISIELALHPDERMEAFAFLKMFRIELDRLIEQSPSIPEDIIKSFKIEFRTLTNVKRPEITGSIEHTQVFNNKNDRLRHIAEEAALSLAMKKRSLHNDIMQDIETRVIKLTHEAIQEGHGSTSMPPGVRNRITKANARAGPSSAIGSAGAVPYNTIIDVDTILPGVVDSPSNKRTVLVPGTSRSTSGKSSLASPVPPPPNDDDDMVVFTTEADEIHIDISGATAGAHYDKPV